MVNSGRRVFRAKSQENVNTDAAMSLAFSRNRGGKKKPSSGLWLVKGKVAKHEVREVDRGLVKLSFVGCYGMNCVPPKTHML